MNPEPKTDPRADRESELHQALRLAGVSPDLLAGALRELDEVRRPRLQRWWTYYHNPMVPLRTEWSDSTSDRPYRQGQEWGLPSRITGYVTGETSLTAQRAGSIARKEVVIENDIGWRVDAMVDHLFGRPITPISTHPDPRRREAIGQLLAAILDANGGLPFLQQAAVLGMVYGFVDILVKLDTEAATSLRGELLQSPQRDTWSLLTGAPSEPTSDPTTEAPAAEAAASGEQARGTDTPGPDADPSARPDPAKLSIGPGPGTTPDGRLIERLARLIRLEIVHPSHALPLPGNSPSPTAYVRTWTTEPAPASASAPKRRWWSRPQSPPPAENTRHLELLTPTHFVRSTGTHTLASGRHSLGELPLVHIQNLAVAFDYAGRSDVEPLIPLQDELNSRLSDRAYRITMQSFRMFLGKGVDNFLSMPVGPGRMWATDNQDAEIEEFGGDQRCPSEEAHIADIREAMDKTSSVPPVAAGLIRDRVGQLSSAAALRVTLQSLLAKTERKRATYGRGLAEIFRLSLAWLDAAELLPTDPGHRGVSIGWPSPVPENSLERLREAEIKARLGVPLEQVRKEIGY